MALGTDGNDQSSSQAPKRGRDDDNNDGNNDSNYEALEAQARFLAQRPRFSEERWLRPPEDRRSTRVGAEFQVADLPALVHNGKSDNDSPAAVSSKGDSTNNGATDTAVNKANGDSK